MSALLVFLAQLSPVTWVVAVAFMLTISVHLYDVHQRRTGPEFCNTCSRARRGDKVWVNGSCLCPPGMPKLFKLIRRA